MGLKLWPVAIGFIALGLVILAAFHSGFLPKIGWPGVPPFWGGYSLSTMTLGILMLYWEALQ